MQLKLIDSRLEDPKMMPAFATEGAAAIDLRACIAEPITMHPGDEAMIGAGFAIHLDNPNLGALIIPRSGLGSNKGIVVGNLVGLIDSDYQGEIKVCIWYRRPRPFSSLGEPFTINPLDRIAQLVITPVVRTKFEMVKEFSTTTKRGSGGFGSTGKS